MRVIQTVVQLPCSQRTDKCCEIFKRISAHQIIGGFASFFASLAIKM